MRYTKRAAAEKAAQHANEFRDILASHGSRYGPRADANGGEEMSSRYMDNYDSDPNMQGDGPPMLVLGHVRKTGGATNRIIFDSTDHPDHARAAELADLEREIGRAVIGYDFVHYALGDKSYEPNLSHAYMLLCMEKANLIARWRELHAEGPEGGKG